VIDPQRDVIDDRKRSKPLGQAAQINGRQSYPSLRSVARSGVRARRCRPFCFWLDRHKHE
jgi:hypothetical protein